ncbi:hypothetical protein EC968_004734 [Mortierella alpina]|nr:hypothetical protein EC968_004734 [Mortierella alpina]
MFKLSTVTIALVLLFSATVNASECPEGYKECQDNCGRIADSGPTKVACNADCLRRCGQNLYNFGCSKGYCWSGCSSFGLLPINTEWCWTTRGSSQDRNYVRCSSDDECSNDWHCGGPCAAI